MGYATPILRPHILLANSFQKTLVCDNTGRYGHLNGGYTHPIVLDQKQSLNAQVITGPGKCNVNTTILSLLIYSRFRRINVCSVVAGGGKFTFAAFVEGRDVECRMLLLA